MRFERDRGALNFMGGHSFSPQINWEHADAHQKQLRYEAAALRANALSDAPEGSPAAEELAGLVADLRAWDDIHKGEQKNGPEPVDGLTRPDDMTVCGLPGNLGKLHAD
jgi:hypothetical protein